MGKEHGFAEALLMMVCAMLLAGAGWFAQTATLALAEDADAAEAAGNHTAEESASAETEADTQAATEDSAVEQATEPVYEYEDSTLHVVITKDRAYNTNLWVAQIRIASADQLRTVSAGGYTSTQVVPGEVLAKRVNAVLAVNGDYYCYSGDGYLVRDGILYRDVPNRYRDTLMIDANGDFHLVVAATDENLAPYRSQNIRNSFNFGPALVVDGAVRDPIPDNNQVMAEERRQRLCVAQTGPLEYLFIAAEGPTEDGSWGLTLKQLARVAYKLGAVEAYNLDGGNSTMMIFQGQKVNAAENANVRDISDILYFVSAEE